MRTRNSRNAAALLKDLRRAPRQGRHVVAVEVSGGVVTRVGTTAPDATIVVVDYDTLGPEGDDAAPTILSALEDEIECLPFRNDAEPPAGKTPRVRRLRAIALALGGPDLQAHACADHLREYADQLDEEE